MSRNNTGNPIGSMAADDFEDNVKNLDVAVNTEAATWFDRFGRPRKSLEGQEQEFDADQERREQEFRADQSARDSEFRTFIASSGYQFAGDYAAGIEITQYNQVIRDSNGEFWRISGQVDLPYVTTGAGIPEDDALVPVGDAVLRQQLAAPDGAERMGYDEGTVKQKLDRTLSREVGRDLMTGLSRLVNARGGYIRNHDSRTISVGIGMEKSLNSVIEYRFRYDGGGLLLLRGGYVGVEDESTKAPLVTLEGAFNTGSAPQTYTTSVGAKVHATFVGDTLRFVSRVDDRGGIWKVTLDNGMTRNISTWSSTAVLAKEQVVFEDLEYRQHEVILEFMGDDPFHEPSSSARGWIRYVADDVSQQPLTCRKVGFLNLDTAIPVLSPNSIPDFALSARLAAASYDTEWVPQHGSVGGVSAEIEMKLIIDGVTVAQAANTMLPSSLDGAPFSRLLLVQSFVSRNPHGSEPNRSMWRHTITHTLDASDGIVHISNGLQFLQDTYIDQAYFGMLPVESANSERLLLDNGVETHDISSESGPASFGWSVKSALFAGVFEPGNFHGLACNVPSLTDSSAFATAFQPAEVGRITYRSDGVSKVYWRAITPGVVPAGYTIRSEHSILLATGIRYPNYLLRSL